MKKLKKTARTLYWLILTALVIIAGFVVLTTLNLPGNYKIMTVLSGSMEPAIKTGSVIVIKPESNYQKGDIVSFKDPIRVGETTTHRISKLSLSEGSYVTKGDANKSPDLSEVKKGNIFGKVLVSVPFLGYGIEFIKTKNGLLFLVIIPSVLIIVNEAMNIKKETLVILRKKKYV